MTRIAILLVFLLTGCASLRESAESTDTFAACKTLDVATTLYGVRHGIFVEKNPLVAPLISHGPVPFILISVAIWYALKTINEPRATMVANTITCPVAAHNVLLLVR